MAEAAGIRWSDWEPGALARAGAEGKLIFLDIGATWCHWCHVLDRTSLADPRVVRMLNEDFVSIRVDTDRRPDINDRYNQGGWPTTAVLLPDGRLLTGATYLPPDALAGLLEKCRDFYRRDRERVDAYLRNAGDQAAEGAAERSEAPEAPRPEDLPLVKHAVLAQYDPAPPGVLPGAEVPRHGDPRFPPGRVDRRGEPRGGGDAGGGASEDGGIGTARPGGRRVLPVRHPQGLDRPPLREDAGR